MATVTRTWEELPYIKSYNLKQGDDWIDPCQYKIKAEAAATYSNLNLTGCTINLYVYQGTTQKVSTTITADTASEGKFTIRVAGVTTGAWTGDLRYEVQVTFPSGHSNFPNGAIRTMQEGSIRIRVDLA